MYLLWRMYPTQSSDVTMPNAIASRALVAVHTWKILSLAFKMLFTWLKTSSNGIRSGEYGGKKLLLLVQQSQLAGSTWWTEQLSIITIDRPSNGFRIGIRVSETNSSNLSPFTDPSTNWTSCTPSMDITVTNQEPVITRWYTSNTISIPSLAVSSITSSFIDPNKHCGIVQRTWIFVPYTCI